MMNEEKTHRLIHYRTNKVLKGMPQKITLTGIFLKAENAAMDALKSSCWFVFES